MVLVLRDEFRESPTSVSAVLTGTVTLRCQPPRGTPDPRVLTYTIYQLSSLLLLNILSLLGT